MPVVPQPVTCLKSMRWHPGDVNFASGNVRLCMFESLKDVFSQMLGIWNKLIDVFGNQYFFEVFSLISFLNLSYQLGMDFQQLPPCAAIYQSHEGRERVSPTPSAVPSRRGGLRHVERSRFGKTTVGVGFGNFIHLGFFCFPSFFSVFSWFADKLWMGWLD